MVGRQLEQPLPDLTRRVGHGARRAVGGNAAATRRPARPAARIALNDLNLLGRDTQDLGGDQHIAAVDARDIYRADGDAHRTVVVDPADRGRRRHAAGPATDGDADAFKPSCRRGSRIARRRMSAVRGTLVPGRVLPHAVQAQLQTQVGPRVAVAHQVAGLDRVVHAKLKRVDPELTRQVVDVRFERESGRRRARRAIGAARSLVGQHLEAVDLDIGALIVAAQENADDPAQRQTETRRCPWSRAPGSPSACRRSWRPFSAR